MMIKCVDNNTRQAANGAASPSQLFADIGSFALTAAVTASQHTARADLGARGLQSLTSKNVRAGGSHFKMCCGESLTPDACNMTDCVVTAEADSLSAAG